MRSLLRARVLATLCGSALAAGCVAWAVGLGAGAASAGTVRASTAGAVPAAIRALANLGTKPITKWPGPASGPKDSVGRKSIVVVPCAMALEGCARQAEGFIQAAKVLGWKTTLIDPNNNPTQMNEAVDQAVTQHASGVLTVSIDPSVIASAIKRANQAHIPVFTAGTGTGTSGGVKHEVSLHGYHEGQILAANIVTETKGQANVAMFTYAAVPVITQRVNGSKAIFAKCSGCHVVASQDLSGAATASQQVALVENVLQAHPNINVLWAPFDAAAVNMVQAVVASHLQGKVTVASFNGNKQNIAFMRQHEVENLVAAEALEWAGWAAADDFLRLFTHSPLPKDDGVPNRILTDSTLPPAGQAWQGDYNFRAHYCKQWAVKCTGK